MSEIKPFRSAVIGVGWAGEFHVRALAKIHGAQLVAVCDLDANKAQAVLDKYDHSSVPVRSSLAELLDKDKPDILHVAVPSALHHDIAVAAMQRHVDVIVEKPLDVTLPRIDSMLLAARETGTRIAGIFQNRFNPASQILKRTIDDGRFGQITWAGAFVLWVRDAHYYSGWRGTKEVDGGGAIMNNSIHSIDLLQWLVGPAESVTAFGGTRVHKKLSVEDTLTCSLKFKNGALGSIVGTTGMFPGRPARIEIGSNEGTAVIEADMKEFKFRTPLPEDADVLGPPAMPIDLHAKNIQDIVSAWHAKREPVTSGPECRKAVAIVLAMYESAARNGSPVPVET